MSTSTASTADTKARAHMEKGDDAMGRTKYTEAVKAYGDALDALGGAYGFMSETLLDPLDKLVEAHYQKGIHESEKSRKEVCKFLKMRLAILERKHGVRSTELIPALEKLIVFYDFDGAHMLAMEVLQRIDDINANSAAQAD